MFLKVFYFDQKIINDFYRNSILSEIYSVVDFILKLFRSIVVQKNYKIYICVLVLIFQLIFFVNYFFK